MLITLGKTGLVLGGAWGLKEGIQRPLGTSSSMKLRINSILNACTRRGSFLGNNLGVLGAFLGSSVSSRKKGGFADSFEGFV